ncbi:MAG: NAD(P)-dependent oxidoreductase [Pseudomonadota bacterium]|nr:NAD(P)-dependent oxidoreductase [Pseudomonadota bacterium]
MKAAVVGLGQMGAGIAANLHRAGYLGAAWDLSQAACAAAQVPIGGLPDLGASVDVVLFVVPSSREIEACLDTMLQADRPGQVLIDLTTSRPADTRRLAARAELAGRSYLDAGMSGGATGADRGTLTLMMGGDVTALDRCRPMLNVIAARIFHLGPVGAGHTMKLVHNMICHTNFLAMADGRAGDDFTTLYPISDTLAQRLSK